MNIEDLGDFCFFKGSYKDIFDYIGIEKNQT